MVTDSKRYTVVETQIDMGFLWPDVGVMFGHLLVSTIIGKRSFLNNGRG